MHELRRKTDAPAIRRLLNAECIGGIQSWRVVAKTFIIVNAIVWALMMGWGTPGAMYAVTHTHPAGDIPLILLVCAITFLIVEVVTPSVRRTGWWQHAVIPVSYMLLGGGYLIFGFICTFSDNTGILAVNALIQAFMTGWAAYVCRVEHYE